LIDFLKSDPQLAVSRREGEIVVAPRE
jgi:hypothetical protein